VCKKYSFSNIFGKIGARVMTVVKSNLPKNKANLGLQISILTAYFVTGQGKGFTWVRGGLQQRFGGNIKI